ncbi:hypothetical protein FHR54_002267 [Xanthomonas arboricola]
MRMTHGVMQRAHWPRLRATAAAPATAGHFARWGRLPTDFTLAGWRQHRRALHFLQREPAKKLFDGDSNGSL